MFLLLKSQKRTPRVRNCQASVLGPPASPVSLLRVILFPCFSELVLRAFLTVHPLPSMVASLRASASSSLLCAYTAASLGLTSSSLTLSCWPLTCCEDIQEFGPPYAVTSNSYWWVLSVTSAAPHYSMVYPVSSRFASHVLYCSLVLVPG